MSTQHEAMEALAELVRLADGLEKAHDPTWDDAWNAARAALSAGDADWQAVPEGYEWALVSGLKPMLAALERAERKGYLPGAMADEWADFDYLPTTPQEPTP